MTEEPPPSPALLPAGLRDLLPPDAETEAFSVEALMAVFAGHGYERVKPPLLEFADSLFGTTGAAVAEAAFRVMDPLTHRMMGLRPDMTPQIARIASTRLVNAPRPLRLSYAGACVQLRGTALTPDRQVSQAGIELIGPDCAEADAEVVAVAAEALSTLGLAAFSFDLTLPKLTPLLIEEAQLPDASRRPLMHALDRKDAAEVARHGGPIAGTLTDLLLSSGAVESALDVLMAAKLTPRARALAERLAETVAAIRSRLPALRLTLDPVEFRGWQYHTGVCMTLYAPGRPEELARGGRYVTDTGEPACGLTLRPEALLRAAPAGVSRPRLYVPVGGDAAVLRREGYATIAALPGQGDDADAEARRLGCTHLLRNGTAVPLDQPAG